VTRDAVGSIRRRLAELVAVFLGVILAFLADDFRDRLSEIRAEQEALVGLHADFSANARQVSARLVFNRRLEAATAGLNDLIATADGTSVEVPDTMLMALVMGGATYDPIRGSIDALMSSGELRLIRDAELRTALAEWPAALADTNEQERWSIAVANDRGLPALMATDVALDRVIERYRHWSGEARPVDADASVTSVRITPELKTVVALRLYHLSLTTGFLERLQEAESRIIARLELVQGGAA